MTIKFGPAGLGPVKDAIANLKMFNELGLRACEIAFTYSVYIKEKDVPAIARAAKKFGIELSIHAQYWINLNSQDKDKVEKSKKRILDCCKIGEMLGAKKVVFHPGYYGGDNKEKAYGKIKNEILDLQGVIKKNKWKIELAPETTGKVNVFGSTDEILNLVRDTGCSFTIDFAHLLARSNGKMSFGKMISGFEKFDKLHCHFSGIEYSSKGEKRHKLTDEKELKELLRILVRSGKEIVLINESPDPIGDSVLGIKILQGLK